MILAIAKSKIDYVQVDALVLLKILKQCQETGGGAESTQGIMTGMVQSQEGPNGPKRIEITNCFGLPNINNIKGANTDFGEGKIKKLRLLQYNTYVRFIVICIIII